MKEFILSSVSNLDEELSELENLEKMLIQAKNETGSYLYIDCINYQELYRRAESVERTSKPFVLSDAEEGYKSSTSCLSDKQYNFNNKNNTTKNINGNIKEKKINKKNTFDKKTTKINSPLNQVTIDLINKPLKPIQSSRKNFEIAINLNPINKKK